MKQNKPLVEKKMLRLEDDTDEGAEALISSIIKYVAISTLAFGFHLTQTANAQTNILEAFAQLIQHVYKKEEPFVARVLNKAAQDPQLKTFYYPKNDDTSTVFSKVTNVGFLDHQQLSQLQLNDHVDKIGESATYSGDLS